MGIDEFLNNPIMMDIVQSNKNNAVKKQNASYNILTLSTYNSYLENFHSDIIGSLLNPNGLHRHNSTFLDLFITFLNRHFDTKLSSSDFTNCIVTREIGRIDIWIRDRISNQSIIIENKINNAVDMDDQMDRYIAFAEKEYGTVVKAAIYLSIDGNKKAPPSHDSIKTLVKNIGAFTDLHDDLVNGWLQPSFEACSSMDSSSLIYQYISLLKHLANKNMDTNNMENFYQLLSTGNSKEIVETIIKFNSEVGKHRTDKFVTAITDIYPFKKPYRYQPNYMLFQNYVEDGNCFKLDVWFENNGNASIVFWNPGIEGIEGRSALTKKLELVNTIHEFSDEITYGGNGYVKRYILGECYETMLDIDTAVVDFVKKFLNDLRSVMVQ